MEGASSGKAGGAKSADLAIILNHDVCVFNVTIRTQANDGELRPIGPVKDNNL